MSVAFGSGDGSITGSVDVEVVLEMQEGPCSKYTTGAFLLTCAAHGFNPLVRDGMQDLLLSSVLAVDR